MGVVAGTGPKGSATATAARPCAPRRGRRARRRPRRRPLCERVGADGAHPADRVPPASSPPSRPSPSPEPRRRAARSRRNRRGGHRPAGRTRARAQRLPTSRRRRSSTTYRSGGATDATAARVEIRAAMEPDESGVSLGDYSEEECGLVGGFDVPVDEANEFVAYGRYLAGGDVSRGGRGAAALARGRPRRRAGLPRRGRPRLAEGAAQRRGTLVPDAEALKVLAGVAAIHLASRRRCA